jgi:tetratricopeptide (TPR) repeat protein
MQPALSTCASCGFSNPKTWHTCARCGSALASSPPRRPSFSGALVAPDATVVEKAATPGAAPVADATEPRLEESAPDHTVEQEAPFIGQVEVSETIRAGVERAFTLGMPTLVALEGGRGSGKTRLLVYASEFAARIEPDVLVLYAACREGGDGAYAPFSRLLLERFHVTPSSGPAVVRGQMAMVVGEVIGSIDAIRVAETTHLLGHVAGVPFPDSPFLTPLEGRPDELRRRARLAVKRFLEGEAQKRPVLVLLDNMHEADTEAWDILDAILQADAHLSVVVAGDAPVLERAQAIAAPGGTTVGRIATFGEGDVATMLLTLLPTLVSVPEPLVAAVTHRSRGNPSALRELVIALAEAGLFRPTPDGLVVDLARLDAPGLPVSAEDAIRARLSRLEAFERGTLDRAAVVGEVFWSGAVLAQLRTEREAPGTLDDVMSLWPGDDDERALDASIARLEAQGFVELTHSSDLPGTKEYVFVHAGTRALLYGELPPPVRITRHAAIARFLTLRAEFAREGIASMIAPHLERAGMNPRAGRAYLEAGVFERQKLRTAAALRFVEKALPLIDREDVARRVEALHEHGSLLTTLGRYDEAKVSFSEMLRLAWQIGAPNKGGAALNRLARIERQRGAEAAARVLLERALTLFRNAGDLRGVGSTLDDLAQVMRLMGELQPAHDAAHEALEIRRAHGDVRGEALSLTTYGAIELALGHLDVAEDCFRQALEIRRRIGDHEGLVQSLNALGIIAFERGNAEAAITSWREALTQTREIGDVRTEVFLLNNLGEALISEKRLDEAVEPLTAARELSIALGDLRTRSAIERNLGVLLLRRNDDGAEAQVTLALALAEQYGSREAIGLALRALGELRARTLFDASGQVDKRAEEALLASIDVFREIGSEKEAARSMAELGFHLVERGDLESARDRLGEARVILRRIGLTADAERVERTLADCG